MTPVFTRLTRVGALAAATILCTSIAAAAPADAKSARTFANCKAMNKVYPHGVGTVGAHDHVRGSTKPVTTFKRSNTLYKANKARDRDRDNVACEKR